MRQSLGLTSMVVRDYDEAITFFTETLGFDLIEDLYVEEQKKRWVVVSPPGGQATRLLLARAVGQEQSSRIGNQTGGRVFLFLYTDDFWQDYHAYLKKGVEFVREPKTESYGTVAVFKDLYGNLWDLIESSS
jgi:catechol 2,3-dioxygenase-like lactoylglutathione lyase family enzyme